MVRGEPRARGIVHDEFCRNTISWQDLKQPAEKLNATVGLGIIRDGSGNLSGVNGFINALFAGTVAGGSTRIDDLEAILRHLVDDACRNRFPVHWGGGTNGFRLFDFERLR